MIIQRQYRGAVLLCCWMLAAGGAAAQKSASELTLVYDYSTAGPAGDSAQNAIHTVYIKGNKSRSEMTSPFFSSTTLFDVNTGSGVILREVNGQKLLIRMNPDNWTERNRMYDGIIYKNTGETREIAGYKCIKAVGQTRFGAVITVYYTRDIIPENRQYDPIFRNLDGLPLEYELTNGNVRIRYRIARINLNPVPVSKFDVPSTGYREMNYEESKKMNLN
jgi:GLPGLI family protein